MVKKRITFRRNKRTIYPENPSLNLEMIRERAYFIWEKKGKPENTSLEDWLEAEKSVK
jgi:hypothetical protein